MSIFEIGAFLIGLSAIFGYLNHKVLRLPHTIGLVVIQQILADDFRPSLAWNVVASRRVDDEQPVVH